MRLKVLAKSRPILLFNEWERLKNFVQDCNDFWLLVPINLPSTPKGLCPISRGGQRNDAKLQKMRNVLCCDVFITSFLSLCVRCHWDDDDDDSCCCGPRSLSDCQFSIIYPTVFRGVVRHSSSRDGERRLVRMVARPDDVHWTAWEIINVFSEQSHLYYCERNLIIDNDSGISNLFIFLSPLWKLPLSLSLTRHAEGMRTKKHTKSFWHENL